MTLYYYKCIQLQAVNTLATLVNIKLVLYVFLGFGYIIHIIKNV